MAGFRAYGAIAAMERPSESSLPTDEIKVHNLTFDLNAYGNDMQLQPNHQGFHMKIYGTTRQRHISLVISRMESNIVKALRAVLDQKVAIELY